MAENHIKSPCTADTQEERHPVIQIALTIVWSMKFIISYSTLLLLLLLLLLSNCYCYCYCYYHYV